MSFRRTFAAGLFIVLPVIVTFWLLNLLFGVINGTVTPVLTSIVRWVAPTEWLAQAWVTYVSPLVGITLAVVFVYVVGLVGGNVIGRQLLRGIENLVLRVPLVRGVYAAVRQLFGTFSRTDGKAYNGVVLVEFPRRESFAIGLVTGTAPDEVGAHIGRKMVTVFVPTSPNPTGGYVLFLPEDNLIRLDMTVDAALKLILSGGALTEAQGKIDQLGGLA